MKYRSFSQNLGFVLLAVALSACGLMKSGNMQLASGGFNCKVPAGQAQAHAAAFSNTVYAATGSCASCHGSSTTPLFHVGNPVDGWGNLTTYFGDGSEIQGVRDKVASGHNIAMISGGVAGLDQQIANFHTQYDALCAASLGSGGGNATPTPTPGGGNNPTIEANRRFSVPVNLGTLTATASARTFQMASGTAAPFNSVTLSADFNLFDAAGTPTVVMKNLRVLTPNATVRIYNVRFKVGDAWKWDDYLNFSTLDKVANQSTTATAVSADYQILGAIRVGNAADTLTITAQMDVSVNQELTTFVSDVKPILMSQCAGCHSNVGAYQFNANTTDANLRTLTIAKVNKTNPAASLLFTKAQLTTANGGVNHNGSGTGTKPLQNDATSVNKIKAWIMML